MAQQHAMGDSPDGGVPPQVVRQMWSLFEPVHAVAALRRLLSQPGRQAGPDSGQAAP